MYCQEEIDNIFEDNCGEDSNDDDNDNDDSPEDNLMNFRKSVNFTIIRKKNILKSIIK